jgi:hypothetical protein
VSVRRLAQGLLALLLLALPARAQTNGFSDWAALVVAGDWRAASGANTQAFDNARRDLASSFVDAGFAAENLVQASLRPARAGDDPAINPSPRELIERFKATAAKATGGCLVYLTSHGAPDGVVFGADNFKMRPRGLARLLDDACGRRPTVVVVSACFSGVFVPALSGPNRMVMTAARADRTSFGCGEEDKYPYFDACVIESLPESPDFVALSTAVAACVARKEKAGRYAPPAEPQTAVGAELRPLLTDLRFRGG